jgi:hypothetical protein
MRRHGIHLRILGFLFLPSVIVASPPEEVRGTAFFRQADSITYSLRSQKANSSIPATLKPVIQGTKLTLDYQFGWMSCSESDQSVLVKGDSVIIQKILFGGCVKTMRAYGFHAEMEGIPNREFMLMVRLVDAREDRCNPSIKTISSMLVRRGSSMENARKLIVDSPGKVAFRPSRSKETFKTGLLKVAKNSGVGYQVQRLEDSSLAEPLQGVLNLHVQDGEVAFESRDARRQCEDNGIGFSASGDTIYIIHRGSGGCDSSVSSHRLKGRILNLSKGQYSLKMKTTYGTSGICEKSATTTLSREFVIP